ncbi:VCBS domain-containing protein [uncultured Oceanisphaera sp.]|uniref:VCBS domain-containing protein n=1 Tax=uncultured Oceanisphaera sp. TaxID=353858 RepID=UPI002606E5F4|nr:VCBS domain-containing protein [uncultured Oceanisphaera sp.]
MNKQDTPKTLPKFRRKPLITALESRILLDGAAVATAVDMTTDVAFQQDPVHQPAPDQAVHFSDGDLALAPTAASESPAPRREVAVVDTQVADYQTLIDGLAPGVEIMLIDGGQSGLDQLAAFMAEQTEIDTLHIFSHGRLGELILGTDTFNSGNINDFAPQFESIGNSLAADADILLYGCDVGSETAGQSFLNELSRLTGADIAASDDDTGHANQGADWELEVEVGQIESTVAIGQEAQAAFDERLSTTNLINGLGGDAGFGENAHSRNDDAATSAIDITGVFGSQGVRFGDNYYTNIYINNNGVLNFGSSTTSFTPGGLINGVDGKPAIALYWTDLDTRYASMGASADGGTSTGSNLVYWDIDTVNQRIIITWDDVGEYGYGSSSKIAGQIVLEAAGAAGSGDMDFSLRYEHAATLDGHNVQAGWNTGTSDGTAGVDYYEIPLNGSGFSALADLDTRAGNTGTVGLWEFSLRNGGVSDAGAVSVEAVEDQAFTFAEDTFQVSGQTADKIQITTLPTNGVLKFNGVDVVINSEVSAADYANLTYIADDNYHGTDSFDWKGWDGSSWSSTAEAQINIAPANDAPNAGDDAETATESGGVANGSVGSNATGNVLTNDSDVDSGDSKVVSAIRTGTEAGTGSAGVVGQSLAGSYGSLTLNEDGSYSYVIDENNAAVQALRLSGQTLSESFSYTVTDAAGATDTATLTITIEGRNDAPVATNDTATAVEAGGVANGSTGTDATGNVLSNDSDVDSVANGETKAVTTVEFGDTSGTVGSVLNGQYGSLTLNEDGSYSYVIDENNAAVQALRLSGQTLSESFSYTVTDAAGATDTATLTITIEGSNDAPVASNDTAIAVEAGGVTNGTAGSNASGNVLSNDSDVDSVANGETKAVTTVEFGDTSGTVGSVLNGQYGSLTLNEDGSYSYVIDENNAAVQALRLSGQTLSETFSYTVTDAAGATDTATLTITIEGSNDAPVASNDTAIAVEAGGVTNGTAGSNASGNVLSNDSDVDSVANGETKAVTTVEFGDTSGTVGSVLNGQYGSLTLNEDGSYSYVIDENNAAVQALRLSGQPLSETFSYTVTDAAGATDSATLTITIEGSNDAPVASNDTATAVEAGGVANGSVGSDATGNVLSNDSDVDSVANGETKAVTTVEFGDTSGTVGSVLNGQYGSLTLNEDGSYSYVIDENNAAVQALRLSGQTLNESFSYTVTDAAGATDTATLTITIEGSNDAPVATNDTAIAVEAGGVTNGTAGSNASGNVLSNDSDVDSVANGETKAVTTVEFGDTSGTVGSVLNGQYGSLTLNEDGSYSYVIDENNAAVQALRLSGQTLSETFSYTVTDAAGATDTATLTITIEGSNDAPVALTTNIDEQWNFGKDYQRDISVLFTDMDSAANGEDLDFVIKGLPKGLSYNPETGLITGKPTEAGKFAVTLTAVDQAGAQVSREYLLEVLAPPKDTPVVKPVSNNDVPPFQRDNTSVTNELSSLPQGLVNKDGSQDNSAGVGFVTPKTPTDTVLLSETGVLVVQTIGTDGNTTVRASVDVSVNDNGEVVFSEVQRQAFDTIAMSVSSIVPTSRDQLSISIADSKAEQGQSYSGSLADGSVLPNWVTIDPNTGNVTVNSPGQVKDLTLRIQAVGSDGQVRILEIKLDIEALLRDKAAGESEQTSTALPNTGFVPLSEQLATEVDTMEAYGNRLLNMLTTV